MINNEPWLAIKYLKQNEIDVDRLHDFLLIVYEKLGYTWENLDVSFKGVYCFEIQALIEILENNHLIVIKNQKVDLSKIKGLKIDLDKKYYSQIENLLTKINQHSLLSRIQFILKKNYLLKFSKKLSNKVLANFAEKYGWQEVASFFRNIEQTNITVPLQF